MSAPRPRRPRDIETFLERRAFRRDDRAYRKWVAGNVCIKVVPSDTFKSHVLAVLGVELDPERTPTAATTTRNKKAVAVAATVA